MNKLLLTLGLASLLAFNASALVQSFTVPITASANYTNLVNEATRITSLTIVNSSVNSNLTITIFDAPLTNHAINIWHDGIRNTTDYQTIGSYTTNITRIYTSITGISYTNTFSNAVYTYTNTAPGFTNLWRTIYTGVVGSNSSVTVTFPAGGYPAGFGISVDIADPMNTAPTLLITHDPNL